MPCSEHWAKKYSKILPQGMFKARLDTFGKDFGHFWNFETFLIFLKFLEGPTLHVTRGNFFSKKLPQNMFKTSLENFGNDFGPFCNF